MTEQPDLLVAGRYRLLERIGAGGMGHVWRGWDERLSRPVAVKLLHSPAGLSEGEADVASLRAMREARITARLHHPNAVPVFDVVDHEGRPCLVMQFLPSRSLQDLLAELGTLPVGDVARLGSEVAAGLAAAHEAGIVHRDVKPGNVLVGDDGTARITDFGISHALGDASLTSTGLVTGTPAYLAPEVARGAPSSAASDVFSLGSTLYAALEGAPPFGLGDNAMALLHRVASGTVETPRDSVLSPILARMLDADPDRRPSMDEVARSLADVAAGRAAHVEVPRSRTEVLPVAAPAAAATEVSPATPPRRDSRPTSADRVTPGRRRRRALLAVLVALALVGGAAAFIASRSSGTGPTTAGPPSSGSVTTSRTSSPAPSTTPTSPTTRTTPTQTRPPATTTPPAAPVATAQELERAVRDYYALLPDDRDAGWDRLSDRYRETTAKDRETYDAFWGSVDKVSTHQVKGTAPDSVTATVRYDFGDGRRVEEVTAFTFVRDGDALLIDTSAVRSSQAA